MLLVLAERPAHGWDVPGLLGPLGHGDIGHGHTYRVLRAMEADGLVGSEWDLSPTGPPRRMYRVTGEGRIWAAGASDLLRQADRHVAEFLDRYDRLDLDHHSLRAAS